MQAPQLLEMEVYSEASNMPVLRFPGRRFPGVLIQGDSLAGLLANVASISQLIERNEAFSAQNEVVELVSELQSTLGALVDHYATTLSNAGIPLPFVVGPTLEPFITPCPAENCLPKNIGQQVGQADTDKAAILGS